MGQEIFTLPKGRQAGSHGSRHAAQVFFLDQLVTHSPRLLSKLTEDQAIQPALGADQGTCFPNGASAPE